MPKTAIPPKPHWKKEAKPNKKRQNTHITEPQRKRACSSSQTRGQQGHLNLHSRDPSCREPPQTRHANLPAPLNQKTTRWRLSPAENSYWVSEIESYRNHTFFGYWDYFPYFGWPFNDPLKQCHLFVSANRARTSLSLKVDSVASWRGVLPSLSTSCGSAPLHNQIGKHE